MSSNSDASQEREQSHGPPEGHTVERFNSDLSRIAQQERERSNNSLEDRTNGLSIDDPSSITSQQGEQSHGPLEDNTNGLSIDDTSLNTSQQGELSGSPPEDNTDGLSISVPSLTMSQETEQSDGPPEDNTNGLSINNPTLTASQDGELSDGPQNSTNGLSNSDQSLTTSQEGELSSGFSERSTDEQFISDKLLTMCQEGDLGDSPPGNNTNERPLITRQERLRRIKRSYSSRSRIACQGRERSYHPRRESSVGPGIKRSRSVPSQTASDYPIRRRIIARDPNLIASLCQTITTLNPMESTMTVEVGFLAAFIRNLEYTGLNKNMCRYLSGLIEKVSSLVSEKLAAIRHGLGGQRRRPRKVKTP